MNVACIDVRVTDCACASVCNMNGNMCHLCTLNAYVMKTRQNHLFTILAIIGIVSLAPLKLAILQMIHRQHLSLEFKSSDMIFKREN